MKVNAQTFFNFCARHVALLRALGAREGEVSQPEVMRIIAAHVDVAEEMHETSWRRLLELQVLCPSEPGSQFFLMADPVRRLLSYLFDESNPATPEMIRGYVSSLEALNKQLARQLEEEDVTGVGLAFREINDTLRRIYSDLDETHHCILTEVARFKTTRHQLSVRDKYRRIVHWMERYVEPMIEIVRSDGLMRGSFDATERLLRLAGDRALFNDHPALERNLRYLRLVRKHALRVFQQCRKEIQPLYEALRRSSFIAEGAALLLQRLQSEGLDAWGFDSVIGVHQMRIQNVPSDAAIATALRRLTENPPESAPFVQLDPALGVPVALLRRQWLDLLPSAVRGELPVPDLLDWLVERHPEKTTAELLAGFTVLIFNGEFTGTFADSGERDYPAPDGVIHGSPLQLDRSIA